MARVAGCKVEAHHAKIQDFDADFYGEVRNNSTTVEECHPLLFMDIYRILSEVPHLFRKRTAWLCGLEVYRRNSYFCKLRVIHVFAFSVGDQTDDCRVVLVHGVSLRVINEASFVFFVPAFFLS